MCGIIGLASVTPVIEQPQWIIDGAASIIHRGPDSSGFWSSENKTVHLGHRRLAIIDLSKDGHQPMTYQNKQLTIVFNGEIYNYKSLKTYLQKQGYSFKSNSDTEVILASYLEWGLEFLKKLNGVFALCLYDEQTKDIILARDRAGEKPLFYYKDSTSLRFCSELKGLMEDKSIPREIKPSSMDEYFHMGFISRDSCILKGFNKLKPGSAYKLNLKTNEVKQWEYWSLPEYNPIESENELLNELESLLTDSINLQLESSDVTTGVLLSGGVDSSLITALASKGRSNLKTYNVSFPDYQDYDEAPHARIISNHFSTNHSELKITNINLDSLPLLARQFDEPMADSSMLPTFLLTKEISKECKVALGGDGGDELFGGYGHYSNLHWQNDKLNSIPSQVRKFIGWSTLNFVPMGLKGRNYLEALNLDPAKEVPFIYSFFDSKYRQSLFKKKYKYYNSEKNLQHRFRSERDIIQRLTRMDFNSYLPEDILVKIDRTSMLNSLELRAPFLDHRVIDFAFEKIPSSLKANNTDKKILLKKLAKKILPEQFDFNRKQGFSIPLSDWLKSEKTRGYFESVLLDEACPFCPKVIKNLLSLQNRGYMNEERIFSLLIFELWRKTYNVSI